MSTVEQENAALVGAEAAHQIQRAQLWRLAIIGCGTGGVAMAVVAHSTGVAVADVLAVVAWTGVLGCAIGAQVAVHRAKALAATHLGAALGFPVPRACFATPQGWRTFIERERRYQQQGYRPKFSITVGRRPGTRR